MTCSDYRSSEDGKSVALTLAKTSIAGVVNNTSDSLSFKFDGILEGAGQDSVYATCAHEVAESLLAGYNGTIFCYGQTGAGKTYTMSGESQQYSRRGITPRALHQIFEQADIRVDRQTIVRVSFVEVYNEVLYDLLSAAPGSVDSLQIVEEGGSTVVKGLTQIQVASEEEALALLFEGEANRSTASHALNAASSRSHTVFTIHCQVRMLGEGEERATTSKLNLVDLAGSERTKKTGVTGQALKEANAINKSLTFLEQTVNALSRKESHVPFRQSKLTSLLRDALGGNCKTVLIANVWPEAAHTEETISTLRFASRVRLIETAPHVSESYDPSLMLRRYERQIRELKAELTMRDSLAGRGQVNYSDLTDAEVSDLKVLVSSFLEGSASVDQLPSQTLKQVKETYRQMQLVYQASKSSQDTQAQGNLGVPRPSSPSPNPGKGLRPGSREGVAAEGVGEEDPQGAHGFHVGLAPANLRPPQGLDTESKGQALSPRSPLQGAYSPGGLGSSPDAMRTRLDRNAAFIDYKRDVQEGRNLDQAVKKIQSEHKTAREELKQCGLAVNAAKREIDDVTAALGAKRAEGVAGEPGVLDSEEHQLLQTLKAAKMKFRGGFQQLKVLQSGLPAMAQTEAEACKRLIDAFDAWFAANYVSQSVDSTHLNGLEAEDDEQMVFERMQHAQLTAMDPDSSAFFAARKQVRRKQAAQLRRTFQPTRKA
ncbi:TPA: Kinesin heavy chain [Trebouxia sp. C0005]